MKMKVIITLIRVPLLTYLYLSNGVEELCLFNIEFEALIENVACENTALTALAR